MRDAISVRTLVNDFEMDRRRDLEIANLLKSILARQWNPAPVENQPRRINQTPLENLLRRISSALFRKAARHWNSALRTG